MSKLTPSTALSQRRSRRSMSRSSKGGETSNQRARSSIRSSGAALGSLIERCPLSPPGRGQGEGVLPLARRCRRERDAERPPHLDPVPGGKRKYRRDPVPGGERKDD